MKIPVVLGPGMFDSSQLSATCIPIYMQVTVLLPDSILWVWYVCHTIISVGPERNSILETLRDVDWKVLLDQLNLTNQATSIDSACGKDPDPNTSCLRELLKRFIHSRPSEKCNEKIVIALESLGNHYVKEATELKRMI